jgi:2,3-bisphosphoglycerate-dependent phosphoglycerate mutase
MGRLVLLRHAESVWNKKNIFTGWVNVGLSKEGALAALLAGKKIANLEFDAAFVSSLIRAQMTVFLALAESHSLKTPVLVSESLEEQVKNAEVRKNLLPVYPEEALNERHYGDLQGQNKDAIKKEYGEEAFQKWRRGYDTPPPNGESLKMTIERVLPFFKEKILPHMERGETLLIGAHGNTLRGIIMYLTGLSEKEVASLEVAMAEPLIYAYERGKWREDALVR